MLARQRREGHDVHLLTLTRGEATSQRHKYGYSKAEMGAIRSDEMQNVAEALDLSSLTVLDFPDGGFAALDPRELEAAIVERIRAVAPDILVTYAVHGISGHPDHLVAHAVVKRVFCELRDEAGSSLRRLGLFTLPDVDDPDRPEHLNTSPVDAIDVVAAFDADDLARAEEALACYETYQDVVEEHEPLRSVREGVCLELFQEAFDPPLDALTERLPEG
jgi:LmbE family N-acetylglucosaminyl deacetylase